MRGSIRFSDELVETRTVTLQTFMTRIGQHVEFKETVALKKFLTAYDEEWTAVKAGFVPDEDGADTSGKGTSSLHHWMTKARAKLATAVGKELESTPEDATFAQLEAYIQVMHTQIKAIHKETAVLTKAAKDHGGALESIGKSFTTLGEQKFTLAYTDSLASMFGKLADEIAEMAGLWTKQSLVEETDLEDKFNLLVLEVLAPKLALEQRKTILWDYTRKVNHVRKQKILVDKGKITEQELEVSKKEALEVWVSVELISKRVQREMDIWRSTFDDKLRTVMGQYVEKTSEHYGLVTSTWKSIGPIIIEGSAGPYTPPMPTAPPPIAPSEVKINEEAVFDNVVVAI